jgi:hypothetical protein
MASAEKKDRLQRNVEAERRKGRSKEERKIHHEDTKKKGEKKAKKRFSWYLIFHFSASFFVSSCLCGKSSSLLPRHQPSALAEESSNLVAGMNRLLAPTRHSIASTAANAIASVG